jgi:CHAT domain-containing protein
MLDGDLAAASSHARLAYDLLDALPAGAAGKALSLLNLGERAARLAGRDPGVLELAFRVFEQSRQIAELQDDRPNLSYALGSLGALYEQQERYDEAMRLTERAQFIAQEVGRAEILYRWQWQRARLLRVQGRDGDALEAYQTAIETLEPIRGDLSRTFASSNASFRENVAEVYLQLADLTMSRAGGGDEAHLRQARDIIERVKAAELEDFFKDDCVTAQQSRTAGVGQLERATAALYPIVFRDRMDLLLETETGIERVSVDVSREELNAKVNELRVLLEKRTTRQYLRPARTLYDLLIKPVEPALVKAGIDTLVFVPDDEWRTIPVAALHDGSGFVIERMAIATSPGLSLTDPHSRGIADTSALLSGLTEPSQGFAALPSVAEELDTIGGLFQATTLKNGDFSVDAIEGLLSDQNYGIVHIASHGKFETNAENSFLLAWDEKLSMDALQRMVGRTRIEGQPIELLTLSACQTAAGDERAALGLAGIGVKAGARSALATLWYVNDVASSRLVGEFYRQLSGATPMSKAQALRSAQLMTMADRRYRHPSFWAPFILVGNWH